MATPWSCFALRCHFFFPLERHVHAIHGNEAAPSVVQSSADMVQRGLLPWLAKDGHRGDDEMLVCPYHSTYS